MLKIDNFGQDYLIDFNGQERLNIHKSNAIKKELLPIIMKSGNSLTLNFEGVVFVDSSGFQVLIALIKAAELYNSNIEVMNVSEDLKELFDLLNLSDVFQIAAN